MSEAIIQTDAGRAAMGQQLSFEQRLFERSPFGTGLTALLMFLALALSYAAVAILSGVTLVSFSHGGATIPSDTRGALVLSLLIITALGMQRYARLKDLEDFSKDTGMLRECMQRSSLAAPPHARRLDIATVIGVVLGVSAHLLLNRRALAGEPQTSWGAFIWFMGASTFLMVLFARGLELTRMGSRMTRTFIDSIPIDLLRIDQLSLLGRSAARISLVWFSVSAVSCLFFVSGLTIGAAVGFVSVCAAIGIGIFVLTMEHVHQRIKAAKTAELERVRGQIDGVRHDAHASADASLRLQGLISYEKRIETSPEWPFDQTTAMRLGASALILTVPWFGQALAQYLIDRVGQFVH
jgi:hypothetical protein